MNDFTHFNKDGKPMMVDVSGKDKTMREATAGCKVYVNEQTMNLIVEGGIKKGDVLNVAQTAGIMGAKRCSDLIPMCHPINITGVDMKLEPNTEGNYISIHGTVRCKGETGVEMEAMTAVSVAALTIYDMCKAVQRDIMISETVLLKKSGGKSGEYIKKGE